MILTCHDCPKQLSFSGSNRDRFVSLFGWSVRGGAIAVFRARR